jgi:hypothetical protein
MGRKTLAINAQTQAIGLMTSALERLVYIQAAANKMPISHGIGIANGAISSATATGAVAGTAMTSLASTVVGVLGTVAVVAAIWQLVIPKLNQYSLERDSKLQSRTYYDPVSKTVKWRDEQEMAQTQQYVSAIKTGNNLAGVSINSSNQGLLAGDDIIKGLKRTKLASNTDEIKNREGLDAIKKFGLEKDEIKGNRPISYNIQIKEMNGVKDCNFELQSLDKMDVSAFGRRIADILLSVTNDTQLKNGN